METLREQIESYTAELTEIRRDLHAHPELGFEEQRTSAVVAGKLKDWGIEVTEKVGKTGVVGTIRGTCGGSRSVGLRADMDALPIHEATGLPYSSKNPGKMHACGHDGHTTMLLGAARYLASHRDFAGTVNLIFQPAEEGVGGARAMLDDRLFERFPCDSVFGLHNIPGLPAGYFATREGPLMAASGRFEVVFTGRGGHAGLVEDGRFDLTSVQANYVLALRDVIAKELPPGETGVIRAGEIVGHGGTTLNVMPARLYVGGTMRAFTRTVQDLLSRRIEELAHVWAVTAEGAKAEVNLRWLTSPVVNAPLPTQAALAAAAKVAGPKVSAAAEPTTGGEDFAFMMEARPGSFIFLGNGTADEGHPHNVHTPKYDFNDAIIPVGIEYWVKIALGESAG